MPRLIHKSTVARAHPFTSQDLWLGKFTLTTNVEGESTFNKAEALLCTLFLPRLAIASPSKNLVCYGAEGNDAVRVAPIPRYCLASAPSEHHYGRSVADLRRKGNIADCLPHRFAEPDSQGFTALNERC